MTDPSEPLEIRLIGQVNGHEPCLVFLHEGLGCITMWRDFPDRLCALSGLAGLVYSRRGYGRSPPLAGPLAPDFLHAAACVELPGLLHDAGIAHPVLVGHSDGASIAIIHAAQPDTSVRALIAIAPHLFVEPVSLRAIGQIAARTADDPSRLGLLCRHHADAPTLFRAWTSAWLDPAFANWNIEAEAARLRCPVLAVQGRDDQYGTLAQIARLAALAPRARTCIIEDCRHHPHLEALPALLEACDGFLRRDGLPSTRAPQ